MNSVKQEFESSEIRAVIRFHIAVAILVDGLCFFTVFTWYWLELRQSQARMLG